MRPILEATNLTLHFGSIAAVDGVTVTVSEGELVGIIGPNGAGKTTFLNLVTGYLRPEAGRIHFLGRDITGLHPDRITALGVGRSFQVPQLFLSLPVLDNVMIALACAGRRSLDVLHPLAEPSRRDAAHRILAQFGLDRDAHRPASELPEGGRKLLDIALAYALRPRLLLMDEPTSGVSALEKFAVMDTLVQVLQEGGVTAMFVEHDMDVVRRYARRVLAMNGGRIVADGPPEQVLGAAAPQVVGG